MKVENFQEAQIAPCGANCMICLGYVKTEGSCPGCRKGNDNKPKSCISCRIKNCKTINDNGFEYCFECEQFPCAKLKHLDDRYKKNYNFSMIDNLKDICKRGIDAFLFDEKEKWICSDCGGAICVHRGYCSECGQIYYNHTGTKRAVIK